MTLEVMFSAEPCGNTDIGHLTDPFYRRVDLKKHDKNKGIGTLTVHYAVFPDVKNA